MTSFFLFGCSHTVPVKQSFPNVPEIMLVKCEELKKLEKSSNSLSEVVKSVVHNYTLYHECAIKNEMWIEWYEKNKLVFNQIK